MVVVFLGGILAGLFIGTLCCLPWIHYLERELSICGKERGW